MMSETWKIILFIFCLQTQTPAADNMTTVVDKMISSSIKTNIQPCNDFYSYACGNYNEQNFFNAYLKSKNLVGYANHQYNRAIINLLDAYGSQEHQIGENCQALTKKVRNYFEACRKVIARNLTRYLQEIKPGPELNWPILENLSSQIDKWPHGKDFDVFYILGKLRSLDLATVIISSFDIYYRDGYIIVIEPSTAKYAAILPNVTIIQNMLSNLGIENPTAILEDVLETERILLKLVADKSKIKESPVDTSYGNLVRFYPNLNFKSYFVENMPLSTTISIGNPSFFKELNDNMWLTFDKSKFCNYLMIHYLKHFYITTEYNDIFCVEELRKMFNIAVNFLYYNRNMEYQEKFVKPDVTKMFETIVDMLVKHIQNNDLKLTIYQIESLKKKLARIRLNIGDLPDNATCETIEEFYSSVPHLDENNYYKNNLIMTRFLANRLHKDHIVSITDNMLSLSSIIYKDSEEVIAVKHTSLIPPVYDFHYNTLGKYSLLGLILSHRLVQLCYFENLNGEEESVVPIESALQCLKINENTISWSRIRDNVGSEVIRKIVTLKFFNLQPIESVPSWKKHFFVNVAQFYCYSNNKPNAPYGDYSYDRLNRIAMNMEEFSQAFNCPKGSKMNPSEKCRI